MWIIVVCWMMSCGILLAESMIDIKKKKIHIWGAVVIGICGLLQVLYQQGHPVGSVVSDGILCRDGRDLLCGAAIGIFFLAISYLTEGKIGKGDSLYLIALGMLVGFQKMMILSTVALCLTAAVSVVLLATKKGTRQTRLPFLPFLTSAFLLVWVM